MQPGRLILCFVLAMAALIVSRPADADDRGMIAVLPMTSTHKSLQLYETATANALVAELTKAVQAEIRLVSGAGAVPSSATLIVDGRIVSLPKGRIQLEARVSRAGTGRALATLATGIEAPTDIDQLVHQLATRLVPVIRRGLVPRAPIHLPTTVVQGDRVESPKAVEKEANAAPAPATRPQLLIVPASGRAAQGVVLVQEAATESAFAMARRLGLVAVGTQTLEGLANPNLVREELARTGARYALLLHLHQVSFDYKGVLSARGKVRVALVSHEGRVVFDRWVRTGTLVGNRGDRHQSLVYRVADQALDGVLYDLRKVFE